MSMPQELLGRLRDGRTPAAGDLAAFGAAIGNGSACDAQVGAFAMAVRLQGLDADAILALTLAMRDSGACLRWSMPALDGPVVDKHSTGGVGDTVSLVLGPMLAACGAYVPMISGRGLGHTGGTLDKLEAIPGYQVEVDAGRLQRVVRACGVAIVGAGADLAPADRRLYAIRDLTATVDSIALITASILSKKLAEGLQALVLDVKCGNGASLPDPLAARRLARSLVDTASRAGVATGALVTDMDEPLAPAAGNALELRVALRYLRGDARPPRLHEVTLALGAGLLCASGLAPDLPAARQRLQRALDSGHAAQRFAAMVRQLGGRGDLLDGDSACLPRAPVVRALLADRAGHVGAIDALALGACVVALGGGRSHPHARIDHAVGLDAIVPVGTPVAAGQPLAVVHARDEAGCELALHRARAAFTLSAHAPPPRALVLARIGPATAAASPP